MKSIGPVAHPAFSGSSSSLNLESLIGTWCEILGTSGDLMTPRAPILRQEQRRLRRPPVPSLVSQMINLPCQSRKYGRITWDSKAVEHALAQRAALALVEQQH
jgi:hypothetical protein